MEIVNKQARAEYAIQDTFEAGVVLLGQEVKSIRLGRAHLKGSYVRVVDGKAMLINMHVQPYRFARVDDGYDPARQRPLLLHKREVLKLEQFGKTKGVAMVPLRVFIRGRRVKVEIGVGRGKKQYERREDIKKRDLERELRSQFKQRALR